MKRIILTGGGTGGHIYPLLAVAEEIKKISEDSVELIYFGPNHPLNDEFEELDIKIYSLASSKLRRYVALENFLDVPKFFISVIQAFWRLYFLMPDIVFSKGGPGAFAVILAAKFYMIPVVIHESDSIPGLTNRLSAAFAKRIAIAFNKASEYFPPEKTAFVGNPIRSKLFKDWSDQKSAKLSLDFKPEEPVIFVLGGSQGSEKINNFILDNLEIFLQDFQIYHQTGSNNFGNVEELAKAFFKTAPERLQNRYRFKSYFSLEELKIAYNAADIVISRAGSGAIYEIAAFEKPAILIPLASAANDHQKINAYIYAKAGAAEVIEESNLKPNLLVVQIKEIIKNTEKKQSMSEAAKNFAKPEAAKMIGEEILKLIRFKPPFEFKKNKEQ